MNKQTLNYVLIALAFLALVMLNNQLFKRARIDLTENSVYSLSQGSQSIVANLEEPVNLYFFFSEKTSEGLTGLRNYANRVKSLLTEYQLNSDGKLNLQFIDPAPFTEAEDLAAEFGLTAAPVGVAGDSLYFGLGGRNMLDDQQSIAFFDPQQENLLEYQISQLIYQLAQPKKVKVAVLSGLPISGGQNPMTGQYQPAPTFYTQLQQLFDVQNLEATAESLPDDTQLLVLVHPQNLTDKLLYGIDQFVVNGGKLIAFVDPHNEASPAGMGMANSSTLDKLFTAWGIEFDAQQVVLDPALGLEIRTPTGGITRHPGYVGVTANEIDGQDVVTSGLESINGASFGALSLTESSLLNITSLVNSSEHASTVDSMIYAATRDPAQLMKKLSTETQVYTLAAKFNGALNSAFESSLEEGDTNHQGKTDNANLLIVADTDLLSDRFWVQTANFFGQTVATPFANNGDLVANSVENFSGSQELISIRSRGVASRPFTKVEALTLVAEQRFREKEQQLEAQLLETEQKLSELQGQSVDGNALVLSAEQQQAVDEFMQQKLQIRKDLREVRHQLDKDIESLGSWLKFINIGLMPLLMMFVLAAIGYRLRKTSIGE